MHQGTIDCDGPPEALSARMGRRVFNSLSPAIINRDNPYESTGAVGDAPLCWQDVVQVARGRATGAQRRRLGAHRTGRAIVQHIIDAGQIAYGINTGLGALCNITLPEEQLSQLSRAAEPRLRRRSSAGRRADAGHYVRRRRQLQPWQIRDFLRHRAPAARLLNQQITPQVPSQGSVGYLTHMAHIGLALMGIGEVSWQGRVVPAPTRWHRRDLPHFAVGERGIKPGQRDAVYDRDGLSGTRRCQPTAGLGRCHRRNEF